MSKRVKFSDPIFTFDVLSLILIHLDVKDLFRYKRVSKHWNREISLEKWPSRYERLTGQKFPWFQYAFLSNLDKDWNMERVSANSSVTLEFVHNHPEIPWDMNGLSENSNVSVEYILDNPHMDWAPSHYSENPNVTQFHVLNESRLEIDLQAWMKNKNCTFEFYTNHPELEWDDECLYCIPTITVKEYMSVPDVDPDMISEIRDIFIDDIIRYPRYITPEAIQSPLISLQDIRKHSAYFPSTEFACANPNIPIDVIMKEPCIQISYFWLSNNPNLTGDDIEKYPGPYRYHLLSNNPGITFKYVLEHLDMPWDFRALSSKTR